MRPSSLPTIVLASGLALAQSNTTCPNQIYNGKATFSHVNATGTTPFTWNTTDSKPWHMSVQVNQTGEMSDNGNGGTISWPAQTGPALELALSGEVFQPRDCVDLDPEEQMVVARRLLREGIVVPATTGPVGSIEPDRRTG